MKKILALILSLLMIFAAVSISMISATAEDSYVTIENFESLTTGTTYNTTFKKATAITDYVSTTTNGSAEVVEDSAYLNSSTSSTKAVKLTCNTLTYANNKGLDFATLNFTSDMLANSLGFRVWVTGDGTNYNNLFLKYTYNGESYTNINGAAISTTGQWVTVTWGEVDKSGLNWYHSGPTAYGYEVPSKDEILSASSLTINLSVKITANAEAQNFYVDDFQILYGEGSGFTTAATTPSSTTTTTVAPSEDIDLSDKIIDFENANDIKFFSQASTDYNFSIVEDLNDSTNKVLKIEYVGPWNNDTWNSSHIVLDMSQLITSNMNIDKITIRFYVPNPDSNSHTYGGGLGVVYDGATYWDTTGGGDTKNSTFPDTKGAYSTVSVGKVPFMDESGAFVYTGVATNISKLLIKEYNPSANGYGIVYLDDITIHEYEETDSVATEDRASIRLNEVNGMRFYSFVDKTALEALADGADYTAGTLIAPKDILDFDLTHTDSNIDVVYDIKNNELWENNQFVGSIVNVKNNNLNREFVARGYVKIGDKYYYSKTTSVRELAAIAAACKADTATFEGLTAEQQALVNSWAAVNK